jgi:hypothetical protein
MDADQTVDAGKAKCGYPVWYKWRDTPPWEEMSARINSLLRRGATSIHILSAGSAMDTDYEMVIVDGELNYSEACDAFSAWLEIWGREVDEDSDGYDWKTQLEPFRVS